MTEYCMLSACGATTGVCTARPPLTEGEAPVCGCDNVTYWNASVAARDYGVTLAGTGECPKTTAAKCNGSNLACDGNRTCDFELGSATQCNLGVTTIGSCWGLPANCPFVTARYSACNSGKCITHCDAIKAENPFYANSSCH